MVRKDKRDMRVKFVKEMDELAFNLAGAVKRMPSNMLTEKIDAFKALTQYANTINKTPVSEEGNAINEFQAALGVAPGAGGAARGGDTRPGGDEDGDGDSDDADDDDEPDSDDDAESADADGGGAYPASRVSGARNGAGGPDNGLAVGSLSRSVRLPDDQ
jgi:hypothetical protein